jgi:hypothetical protein
MTSLHLTRRVGALLSASRARFVSLESGGHLMLGQQKKGRDELADFFAEKRDRRAERVAS